MKKLRHSIGDTLREKVQYFGGDDFIDFDNRLLERGFSNEHFKKKKNNNNNTFVS